MYWMGVVRHKVRFHLAQNVLHDTGDPQRSDPAGAPRRSDMQISISQNCCNQPVSYHRRSAGGWRTPSAPTWENEGSVWKMYSSPSGMVSEGEYNFSIASLVSIPHTLMPVSFSSPLLLMKLVGISIYRHPCKTASSNRRSRPPRKVPQGWRREG